MLSGTNLSGDVLRSWQDMEIHKTKIAALAIIKRLYFAFFFILGLFPGSTRYSRASPVAIAGSLFARNIQTFKYVNHNIMHLS